MFLDEADAALPLIDDDAGLETHDFILLLDHPARYAFLHLHTDSALPLHLQPPSCKLRQHLVIGSLPCWSACCCCMQD